MGKKKSLTEKVLDPWYYDKVLAYEKGLLEYTKVLTKGGDRGGLEIDPKISKILLNEVKKRYGAIEKSKPFLVGPATLDSLIESTPESYEYVNQGKLPFDNMFFEFPEAGIMTAPLIPKKEVRLRGIALHKFQEENPLFSDQRDNNYRAILYLAADENNLVPLEIHYNPEKKNFFGGYFEIPGMHMTFKANFGERTIELKTSETGKFVKGTFDEVGEERVQPFIRVANLCTNLVNYINAHNVTQIKREREVKKLIKNEKGKKKIEVSKQPYYVVTVRDGVVEEGPPSGREGWELKWRVYVRGHDRRYRDAQGHIYRVSWIPPCIKGPPDAPWKENRYEVLAAKLIREKEMLKKHLI